MQEDPSLTRVGKRFRANIQDTEQNRERHRAETPKRTSERIRKIPMLLLENSTQTPSPPELNTSARSNLGRCVQTPQIPGGGQAHPASAQTQQTNSPRAQTHQPSPSSTQQNPSLHKQRMGDDIKLPIFRGTGAEDPNQHFFLCEAVWSIKQVQDDDTKRA